jgi:hypothetical protein
VWTAAGNEVPRHRALPCIDADQCRPAPEGDPDAAWARHHRRDDGHPRAPVPRRRGQRSGGAGQPAQPRGAPCVPREGGGTAFAQLRRRATDESACTPGSVHGCLAASRWAVIHLGLPLPAGSSGLPAGIGRAALERLRRTAANRRPFLTLLRVGFTEPHRSPGVRWSLTPPFHPYQHRAR